MPQEISDTQKTAIERLDEDVERIVRAARRWAEFMELRVDRFKWSQPERKLYEAIDTATAKRKRGKK